MSPDRPARHWRERVADAIEASEETRGFVSGMDFAAFAADAKTLKAVLANLAIIGEATAHIPDEQLAPRPEIPWKKVRATRNIVVHVYFGVDARIVWDTVKNDLPAMEQSLRTMLLQVDAQR